MGAECSCKITPSKGICTWLAMGFPGTTTLPDNKSRFLANFAKGSLVYRQLSPVPHEVLALSFTEVPMPISNTLIAPAASEAAR